MLWLGVVLMWLGVTAVWSCAVGSIAKQSHGTRCVTQCTPSFMCVLPQGMDPSNYAALELELSSLSSVRQFVRDLKAFKSNRPLDRLVCNAAVYLPTDPNVWRLALCCTVATPHTTAPLHHCAPPMRMHEHALLRSRCAFACVSGCACVWL